MKHYLSQLGILILCITSANAQNLELYVTKMQNAISYIDEHQAETWPRFHLSAAPVIAYDFGENYVHFYAFNFTPVNPAWQRMAIEGRPVYFLDKDIYGIGGMPFGFPTIDGQRSFVFNINYSYYDGGVNSAVADTIGGRFFFYQHINNESNFPQIDPDKLSYPDYNGMSQIMQVKLGYLELEALKNYLKTNDVTQKENTLKDAVAINQYRTSILDADSQPYEPYISRHFGLWAYVGWKALNLKQDSQYVQALGKPCTLSTRGDYERMSGCIEYERYMFLNLVYGLGLDRKLNGNWKSETEEVSTEKLIQNYYHLSNDEALIRVNSIMKEGKYNFQKINQIIDKNLKPYLEAAAKAQEGYKQHPGIEVQVYIPIDSDLAANKEPENPIRSSKSNLSPYHINNKIDLDLNNSEGFEFLNSDENEWLAVAFNNIPYLYSTNMIAGRENRWEKFKVSPATRLVIDNKETTVGDYMKTKHHALFSNLLLENEEASVELVKMKGDLDTTSGTLVIKSSY